MSEKHTNTTRHANPRLQPRFRHQVSAMARALGMAVALISALGLPATAQDMADPLTAGESDTASIDGDTLHPILNDIGWMVGDSTVAVILSFNTIPTRYTAYALENPSRIVIDCYNTSSAMLFDPQKAPRPVVNGTLTGESVDGEIEFLRLVLFTERVIEIHSESSPTRLRVLLHWNSLVEREATRRIKRRRRTVFSIVAGTVVAAVTVGIIAGVSGNDDSQSTDPPTDPDLTIPPPDIPTPDGG